MKKLILAALVVFLAQGVAGHAQSGRANTQNLDQLLEKAAYKCDTDKVKKLLAQGANPNAKYEADWTPLHAAATHHCLKVTKALLAAGANPNAKSVLNQTPLFRASARNAVLVMEALLQAGADPNAQASVLGGAGRAPLHWARSSKAVEVLVKAGADPNISTASGETPLHMAQEMIAGKGFKIVEALLKAGADVNARDNDGRTPLNSDSLLPDSDAVMLLLEAGADPNTQDDIGRTPLMTTAHFCYLSSEKKIILDILLESGADPNLQDKQDRTPLHFAVEEYGCSAHAVHNLLKAGANPNTRDKDGKTPLDYATSYSPDQDQGTLLKRKEIIIRLLKKYMH